jgi:DNA-binding IclR family transcriptional regulator
MFQKINGKIVPHLSLQELAAFLGIHRSSLHKALARLREESIIGDYSKNRLEIYDLEKLSLYCKEPSE